MNGDGDCHASVLSSCHDGCDDDDDCGGGGGYDGGDDGVDALKGGMALAQ